MEQIKRRIKIFLLNLFYRRLWIKIAIILLALVTIPVALLGVLLINTSQNAVRNSVLNNHQQIVARAAQEIGLFVGKPQDVLNITAAMLGVNYPAPWKQETILVELVLNQPIFIRASSVDLSGQEIASSELGRGLSWDYPKEALEGIGSGKTYLSGVKFLDNHTPFVTMAVPIKKLGKIIGALIIDVNLRGMWDIADNIKIGKTGRVFLVSNDGTLIAHQDKKRVLRNENLKEKKEVQSVLAGKTEAIESEDKLEGKCITSYAPISGLGWGIILMQSQDEAYLFSKIMKMQSWIIIILSELVAILVSIFMSKVFASPINTLASKIHSIAAGDLEHKIELKRHDEIGQLIKSFNYMTKKLKKAKARERFSAIGEASAWIAHELKNSMVSIKPFVQLFPRRHMDKEFVDTFSKLVPQEIMRWERMLKELSDFSSHFELNLIKTNLSELIANILVIMKEKFLEKKINVEYNAQNAKFHITVDPERLEQVFRNLIINAVNAMPNGGSLTISTDLINTDIANKSYYVEIKIKDTGIGMSDDSLERLFEPFHTTKKGGMGLGLTISRRIIEQHGGSIRAESAPAAGTTFIVKLPVAEGADYISDTSGVGV